MPGGATTEDLAVQIEPVHREDTVIPNARGCLGHVQQTHLIQLLLLQAPADGIR